MNILFLSSWFPYPPNNGSRIRIYNLIKQLSKKHNITLLSFTQDDFEEGNIEPLKQYCKKIKIVKGRWFNNKSMKGILGYFTFTPRSLVETYTPEMRAEFEKETGDYDLIICSGFPTVLYALKNNKIPKIFEEIEVSVIKDSIKKEGFRKKLTWWKLRCFIEKVLSKYDGYTVVSGGEMEEISGISTHAEGEVIPNGIDILDCKYSFNPDAVNLIYPGALTYGANFDAMDHFLRNIYPLIQKEIPDVRLKITGSIKGVDTSSLKLDKNVDMTGYVDDVKSLVSNSAVCIVPLRIGGGTRVKILESMALGTPVVATSKGAEGIDGLMRVAGTTEPQSAGYQFNIWVEDDPEKFAKAVAALVKNRKLAEQMAINARKLVVEKYDWNTIGDKFEMFIKKISAKKY